MAPPSKGLIQAYELRDLTSKAAKDYAKSLTNEQGEMVLDKDSASGLAALVRAWDLTDDRVRINRGKPLPGQLRPSGKPVRSRPSSTPSPQEPAETPQPVAPCVPQPVANSA